MDLMSWLQSAERSLFRLETRQEYDVKDEIARAKEFVRTGRVDLAPMREWYDFLNQMSGRGVALQRVRLVKFPLTDYTRYELAVHAQSRAHGDDIRAVTKEPFDRICSAEQDFWLIDDKVVLLLRYSRTGEFLGFDVEHDAEEYVQIKSLLLAEAIALEDVHE